MMQLDNLRQDFRSYFDPGDSWGSVMGALFSIADELHFRRQGPPESWQYRPPAMATLGANVRDNGDPMFEILRPYSSYVLTEFGDILRRYRNKLETAGRSC